jgi:hypothetical protein
LLPSKTNEMFSKVEQGTQQEYTNISSSSFPPASSSRNITEERKRRRAYNRKCFPVERQLLYEKTIAISAVQKF